MRFSACVLCLVLLPALALAQEPTPTPPLAQDTRQHTEVLLIFPDLPQDELSGDWWSAVNTQEVRQPDVKTGALERRSQTNVTVKSTELAERFREFVQGLEPIFSINPPSTEAFRLDEIELQLAVTAEGKVGVVATATGGITGGIRVLLRRRE